MTPRDLWMAIFTASCDQPTARQRAALNALLAELERRCPALVPPDRGRFAYVLRGDK